MNQKLIVINGKTYKSIAEMPDDVRRDYESAIRNLDKNQNGLPDAFEGSPAFQNSTTSVINTTKIIVNGQVYGSLDQLPPDVLTKYEQAMGAMDSNNNGIPDFMEGMLSTPKQTDTATASFGTVTPSPLSKPIPVNSTIEPESSGGWLLALTGILLIGLCLVAGAAGVWYFYLR